MPFPVARDDSRSAPIAAKHNSNPMSMLCTDPIGPYWATSTPSGPDSPRPASIRFTDVDGDTVKVSRTDAGPLFDEAVAVVDGQFALLDLSSSVYERVSFVIQATKGPRGDGLVNVGRIRSPFELGTVIIAGDLGAIEAGGANLTTPALRTLSVRSIGQYGLATQYAPTRPDLVSTIRGSSGALKVSGDVRDAFIRVMGGAARTIGSVSIGGSLVGGSGRRFTVRVATPNKSAASAWVIVLTRNRTGHSPLGTDYFLFCIPGPLIPSNSASGCSCSIDKVATSAVKAAIVGSGLATSSFDGRAKLGAILGAIQQPGLLNCRQFQRLAGGVESMPRQG